MFWLRKRIRLDFKKKFTSKQQNPCCSFKTPDFVLFLSRLFLASKIGWQASRLFQEFKILYEPCENQQQELSH